MNFSLPPPLILDAGGTGREKTRGQMTEDRRQKQEGKNRGRECTATSPDNQFCKCPRIRCSAPGLRIEIARSAGAGNDRVAKRIFNVPHDRAPARD